MQDIVNFLCQPTNLARQNLPRPQLKTVRQENDLYERLLDTFAAVEMDLRPPRGAKVLRLRPAPLSSPALTIFPVLLWD